MAEKIILNLGDNTYELIEEKVARVGVLDELLTHMSTASTIDTPLLPPGCFKYSKDGTREFYYAFKPPGIELVNFVVNYDRQIFEYTRIPVAFPSRVYLNIFYDGSWCSSAGRYAFTDAKKYTDVEDSRCFSPWMPNTHSRVGSLCGGTGYTNIGAGRGKAKHTIVAESMAYLDASNYNDHLIEFLNWVPKTLFDEDFSDADALYGGQTTWDHLANYTGHSHRLAHAIHVVKLHKLTNLWISQKETEAAGIAHACERIQHFTTCGNPDYARSYTSMIREAKTHV